MSKSPAFRFYPSDFMGSPDVQAMDLHEVGAYIFLLSTAWLSERPGHLPDDNEKLRRWARMSREQWTESKEILLSKFPLTEDGWRANPRMVREAKKQAAFSQSQSEKGKMGGRPKKPKLSGDKPGLSEVKPNESRTQSPEKPSVSASVSVSASASPSNNSSSNEEECKSKSGADAPPSIRKRHGSESSSKPDGPATEDELNGTGISPNDFATYMAVRRKKHWSFIDTATRERWISKFRGFYEEGKDTTNMLHQMIEGHWQGAVEEKWKQRAMTFVPETEDDANDWLKGMVQ